MLPGPSPIRSTSWRSCRAPRRRVVVAYLKIGLMLTPRPFSAAAITLSARPRRAARGRPVIVADVCRPVPRKTGRDPGRRVRRSHRLIWTSSPSRAAPTRAACRSIPPASSTLQRLTRRLDHRRAARSGVSASAVDLVRPRLSRPSLDPHTHLCLRRKSKHSRTRGGPALAARAGGLPASWLSLATPTAARARCSTDYTGGRAGRTTLSTLIRSPGGSIFFFLPCGQEVPAVRYGSVSRQTANRSGGGVSRHASKSLESPTFYFHVVDSRRARHRRAEIVAVVLKDLGRRRNGRR